MDNYDMYMDEIYTELDKQEEFRLTEVANLTQQNEKLCGIIQQLLLDCEKYNTLISNIKFEIGE
jgi:hypothetical protein